ncbi:hypothetical protein PWT90_07593 [Aphanocladium album]|nr:hypothetical protein PWT90_07593 [Aphanocladium album]
MATNEIILYDLATKRPNKCFSPNCWKTRAALNFKGLPYTTVWLEYPDVKPTLAAFGIKANAPTDYFLEYTCPTVKFSDGTYMMDSAAIAPVLEQLKMEPSLRLDGPHERVHRALGKMFGALMPTVLSKVRDGLSPRSAEYYEATRRPLFNMSLDDLAKSEIAATAWTVAEPGIQEVSAILREQPDGPYVLGRTASYADIILAAGWHCLKLLDLPILTRLYGYDLAFEKHYEACEKWFKRDNF